LVAIVAACSAWGSSFEIIVAPGLHSVAVKPWERRITVTATPAAGYEIIPETVSVLEQFGRIYDWRVVDKSPQEAVYHGRAGRFDTRVTGPWTVATLFGGLKKVIGPEEPGIHVTPTYRVKTYQATVRFNRRTSYGLGSFFNGTFVLTYQVSWLAEQDVGNGQSYPGSGVWYPRLRLGRRWYDVLDPPLYQFREGITTREGSKVVEITPRRWYFYCEAEFHLDELPSAAATDRLRVSKRKPR
jgi:hypothetical protein